jgi:hypothetical protein
MSSSGDDAHVTELQHLIEEMRVAAARTEAGVLQREKRRLSRDMQERVENMSLRMQIMRLKSTQFRKVYDKLNLFIIIISSFAALVETVKGQLDLNDKNVTPHGWYHFLQLLPAITSSITGVVAALIKFKKYAEKLEALGRAVERTIATMSRLTRTLDALSNVRTLDELDAMHVSIVEIMDDVGSTLTVLSSVLKYSDIVKHMPSYHALTISYLTAERRFQDETRVLLSGGDMRLLDVPATVARGHRSSLRTSAANAPDRRPHRWCCRWWARRRRCRWRRRG